MTMLWCTAASMLQPWFDHHRSYREAGSEFARALQGREGECVAGVGVGAAQRAAMHYHAGVRVRSQASQADCPLVLVYANVRSSARDLSRYGEIELWHYQRGGGRQRESFTLRARN